MRIRTKVLLVLAFCGVIGIQVSGYRPLSAYAIEPQDTAYLDRRISMLETRLSSIESIVRTLQQQAMSQRPAPSQPTRDPETALFRSELEIMNARVRELECGLAHLDERTLSANAKEARKRMNPQPNDPCRLNPDTPIQLSFRR
jgi:uncharacterized coiled-coil protein SlyX